MTDGKGRMKVYIPMWSALYEGVDYGPVFSTRELATKWIETKPSVSFWSVLEEEVHVDLP